MYHNGRLMSSLAFNYYNRPNINGRAKIIVLRPNKEKTYLVSVTVHQHKVKPNPKWLPADYTVYEHHMDGVLCHLYIHVKY